MNLIKSFLILLLSTLFLSCEFRITADHVSEGNRLANQGDYFNASLEYDDALFSDAENIPALRGRIFCSMRTGDLDKALKAADQYIKLRPDSIDGYNDRGVIYLNKKEFEKAITNFDKTIDLETPYKTVAYFNKGSALIELGRNEEAIICFRNVLTYDKYDYQAYSKIGQIFLSMNQKDSSCIYFEKAKELGDDKALDLIMKNCN
jgi:tetratricopeptide (TPR) repeat protein